MQDISNQKLGASFEKYVSRCLTIKGWAVTRIPDGCRRVGLNKMIPVKAPFDYFASKEGKAIFFDAKTCHGDSFPYSKINQSQVAELLKHAKNGFLAGYVVNFRQTGVFCFISATDLAQVVSGGSIKSRVCVDLGKEIDMEKLND